MKVKVLKGAFFFIILILISWNSFSLLVSIYSLEIDKTSIATYIVDGDTFDIATGERIRLADVDTPERGKAGYFEASMFINNLIYNKKVYLDIDDIYVYDTYGTRLVCLVYVDYNSTHYLNVNEALLVGNFAYLSNYDNEFNPFMWTLFIPKLSVNGLLRLLLISFIIGLIATFVLNLILRKIRKLLPF